MKQFIDEKGEMYMELDRYLYGLKQSPLKFQLHLKAVLVSAGYIAHSQDECLYYKKTPDGRISILSVHVDDILQVASDEALETELFAALKKAYGGDVEYHPNADSYIGLTIKRSKDKKKFELSQTGLIDKTIEKYLTAKDGRKCTAPASERLFKSETEQFKKACEQKDECGDEETPVKDLKEYLGLVMSLMYVARLSRPDILLAVTFLATRSHKANEADMSEAKRVIRYLRDTREKTLTIHCTSLDMVLICDASFGVHKDSKSHTGWAITLGDNQSYVTCKSAKQKLVALHSTDAEIIAMVDCLKTAIWLRNIIKEFDLTPLAPMLLLQDNKSAIIMTSETSKYKNSKHILVRIAFARQLHSLGVFTVRYTSTELMWADMLTKPLFGALFQRHCEKILGKG